ncbi:MAG: SMP-30/gluconolactonase/LRE family protein [Chthoniobacteraceae bacterium]
MITLLINDHCELGENPLWRPEDGCLYWTDITGGKVHRFHLATKEHRVIYSGETVGGFTFQKDGNLLLFRVRDIAVLRKDGRVAVARAFSDEGMERFNDVIADPEGRVFAGTIGTTATSGGLYRVDRDGAITLLFRGTGCSNGMGFSPDLKTFYWTCSTRRRIYAFDYKRETGTLSGERVIYEAGADEGIPDGLTVDANGHLWSARWDGFAVVHHAPDGSVIEKFPFPVAKVSSLCLGGPDLGQFFVTTAGGKAGDPGEDGAVYQWSAGVRGRAEFQSRIFPVA